MAEAVKKLSLLVGEGYKKHVDKAEDKHRKKGSTGREEVKDKLVKALNQIKSYNMAFKDFPITTIFDGIIDFDRVELRGNDIMLCGGKTSKAIQIEEDLDKYSEEEIVEQIRILYSKEMTESLTLCKVDSRLLSKIIETGLYITKTIAISYEKSSGEKAVEGFKKIVKYTEPTPENGCIDITERGFRFIEDSEAEIVLNLSDQIHESDLSGTIVNISRYDNYICNTFIEEDNEFMFDISYGSSDINADEPAVKLKYYLQKQIALDSVFGEFYMELKLFTNSPMICFDNEEVEVELLGQDVKYTTYLIKVPSKNKPIRRRIANTFFDESYDLIDARITFKYAKFLNSLFKYTGGLSMRNVNAVIQSHLPINSPVCLHFTVPYQKVVVNARLKALGISIQGDKGSCLVIEKNGVRWTNKKDEVIVNTNNQLWVNGDLSLPRNIARLAKYLVNNKQDLYLNQSYIKLEEELYENRIANSKLLSLVNNWVGINVKGAPPNRQRKAERSKEKIHNVRKGSNTKRATKPLFNSEHKSKPKPKPMTRKTTPTPNGGMSRLSL